MADSTILDLPAATAIDGTEVLIVNQAGVDKNTSAQQIIDALVVSGSGAPADAAYIVSAPSNNLSAERVITTTTSIIADTVSNSSQLQLKRAAITGDVTIPENSNTAIVSPNAVGNIKLNDMQGNTLKGNANATLGDPQDIAVSTNQIVGRGTGNIVGLNLGSNLSIDNGTNTLNASAASGAPTDAEYIVSTPNANLSAERVTTSTASIIFDSATAGQLKAERAALTGAITAAQNSNVTSIAADIVTDANLANMPANTIKGNATNGTADPTNITLAINQILGRGTGNLGALTLGSGFSISGTTINVSGLAGITYGYTSSNTTDSDPGTGLVKFNHASTANLITKVMLNNTTTTGIAIGDYIADGKAGSTLLFVPTVASSNYIAFTLAGVTVNTDFNTANVTYQSGFMPTLGTTYEVVLLPGVTLQDLLDNKVVRTNASNELINSEGTVIPTGGETLESLLAAGMVRTNANGQLINGVNAIISGSSTVADYAALEALDEAVYENFAVIPISGMNRSVWVSNGSRFNPLNNQYIHESVNTSIRKVICANNITWTASNNAGVVRLTASAAHGLTTNPAVGYSLYLTNTPVNWDVGSYHEIATVVSTTVVDTTTAWVTGMGTAPTFAGVGTKIPLKVSSLPVLRPQSRVILEFSIGYTADANSQQKRTLVDFNTTNLTDNGLTANQQYQSFRSGFKNLGVTNSQLGLHGSNSNGYAANTLVPNSAAIDTTLTTNTITIFSQIVSVASGGVNIGMELQDFMMIIRN